MGVFTVVMAAYIGAKDVRRKRAESLKQEDTNSRTGINSTTSDTAVSPSSRREREDEMEDEVVHLTVQHTIGFIVCHEVPGRLSGP